LIEKGIIKLIHLDEEGREMIVGLRFPRWLLGAASVILQEACLVTAVTLTPCRLRRIRAAGFLHLARTSVDASWAVNHMLSREVYDQVAHSCGLGLHDARHRLEHFLWKVMSSTDGIEGHKPIRFQLPLKQSELAQLIAVTESYLSRLLKELEEAGRLRRDKGWLIVPDPEKLWHAADL
jgi:CRP-like cAMP-binding protein